MTLPGPSNVTLSSGFSFGFYKSPNRGNASPVGFAPVEPQRGGRGQRRRDGINKGVGHKIKKPKLKAKEKVAPKSNVKTVAKRLKEKTFTPRLPTTRSPVKTTTPQAKKKRHVLSSPGMSFLEHGEEGDEGENGASNKFFTSRSRAAATVHLAKNIKLSAVNGDLSLRQRPGQFEKRNVGRVVEEQLEKFICNSDISLEAVNKLARVDGNSRPVPTRVPTTPSPKKRPKLVPTRSSPRKKSPTKIAQPPNGSTRCVSPRRKSVPANASHDVSADLEDLEEALQQLDNHAEMVNTIHRSPRKNGVGKENQENKKRTSPRKHQNGTNQNSNKRSPKKDSPCKKSPEKSKFYSIFDPKKWKHDSAINPTSQKAPFKYHRRTKNDEDQMMLDAGQEAWGARHCPDCGTVYEVGNPADEATHTAHHNSLFSTIKYTAWKHERVVRALDHLGGRVIMVTAEDSPHHWRKVDQLRAVVDEELGFAEPYIQAKENTRVFMYVLEKRLVGCLVAERIAQAYRVVPQKQPITGRLLCIGQNEVTVWAGVSRLWVLGSERGKGIAKIMVDAMRANMVPNHFLSMDQFAFSDPTESGAAFAEHYTQRKDFLVYRRA